MTHSVIPGFSQLTQAAICNDWHNHYGLLKARMLELGFTWWQTYHWLAHIRNACPF